MTNTHPSSDIDRQFHRLNTGLSYTTSPLAQEAQAQLRHISPATPPRRTVYALPKDRELHTPERPRLTMPESNTGQEGISNPHSRQHILKEWALSLVEIVFLIITFWAILILAASFQ